MAAESVKDAPSWYREGAGAYTPVRDRTHETAPPRAPAAVETVRMLVIDPDRATREGTASLLRAEGYSVNAYERSDDALQHFERSPVDIVMVDLGAIPLGGRDVLQRVLSIRPRTIVIVTTSQPSVASSLEALRCGAWDYLPKPFSGSHLQVLLGHAAHEVISDRERETQQVESRARYGNSDKLTLLGVSPAFRQLIDRARRVAATNASVMITGESGTGKELIAQFVHAHSRRASHQMVSLNCAAMPEHLLESEMFGHRKGAFTGADREKVGLLEAAHQGTLFLDELTEMPLSLQAKLLRVIQDGVVRRVGSEKPDAVVDVRFISATNRDPAEAIREHKLREDLYFRLNVFPLELPPLRQRPEDIPILANFFLERFWSLHHPPRTQVPHLGKNAMEFLCSRRWRGNVRELQNVIEHLVVLARPGSEIEPDEIPVQPDWVQTEEPNGAKPVMLGAYHAAREQALASFEKRYVTQLLDRSAGNMSRAARIGNMNRTTLYRLLERHGFRHDQGSDHEE